MKKENKQTCSKGTCAPVPINSKVGIITLILLIILIIIIVLKGLKIV